MTTWAGYSRVSRVGDRKDTLTSHDEQRERIASYAHSRGLDVELLPEESDVSGGVMVRPILEDALVGVEQGRYAGVIVAQVDRLSRMDLADALAVIRRVEGAGGQVIAVAENFDAGTPEGRLARNVFLSLAELQLDRYKGQFSRSKEQAVERGIWPCPVVPIGYRKGRDKRLAAHSRTRGRILRGFEARAAGKSWRDVAATMGVGVSAAQKIVRNRVYLGEIHYTGFVNLAAHEPIVPRDLWEAAQRPQPRPPRRTDLAPAMLSGLVVCAGCGGAMTPDTGRGQRVYRCRADKAAGRCSAPAHIAQGKLDPYVEQLALEQIESLAISAQDRSDAIDAALSELAAAEAELDAYQGVVRVTDIGADSFAAGMQARVEAVREASNKVGEARAAAGPIPEPLSLRELWPDLSVDERAHVLRGSLGAVWVRNGRGPAAERARVVAAGFGPVRPTGHQRLDLAGLDWSADLPGEIRPAGSQHVE
jgi:DNA invertase Pin-like site-specific DNA recombinase